MNNLECIKESDVALYAVVTERYGNTDKKKLSIEIKHTEYNILAKSVKEAVEIVEETSHGQEIVVCCKMVSFITILPEDRYEIISKK
jgi:hypothetical protein